MNRLRHCLPNSRMKRTGFVRRLSVATLCGRKNGVDSLFDGLVRIENHFHEPYWGGVSTK